MPGCDFRRVRPGNDVGTLYALEDGGVVQFWQDAGNGLVEGEESFVNALEESDAGEEFGGAAESKHGVDAERGGVWGDGALAC